jgi:hypothetical protein
MSRPRRSTTLVSGFVVVVAVLVALGGVALWGASDSNGPERSPDAEVESLLESARPVRDRKDGEEAVRWNEPPLIGGRRITLQDARDELPFDSVVARALGVPESVYLPREGGGPHPTVAFVYRSQPRGLMWVFEAPRDAAISFAQATQDAEALVQACAEPASACEGRWTMATLQDGSRALLIAGPEATSVAWMRGAARFQIMGPADDLLPTEAIAAANTLAAD